MGRFEGYYFKQGTGKNTIAFIAAKGQDRSGIPFASVQVVTPGVAFSAEYPPEKAQVHAAIPEIRIGPNRLGMGGLVVDIEGGGHSVWGALSFGPPTQPKTDVMGPFRFLPGLECRHSVVSLLHEVRGQLIVDGLKRTYIGAPGYIEGDAGRSFPRRYLWTHCFPPQIEPRSLMLSVAEVPYAFSRFTGVLAVIRFSYRELRLATYLGAKVVENRDGRVVVRQGEWMLTAIFNRSQRMPLSAPVDGRMARAVGECLSGSARYRLTKGGRAVFDFESADASFEYEY